MITTGSRRRRKTKPQVTLKLSINEIDDDRLKERLAKDVCHELGHYIAASKGRRHHENYGIKYNSYFAQLDEDKATFIGAYLCQHFGFKFKSNVNKELVRAEALTWWKKCGKAQVDLLLDFMSR